MKQYKHIFDALANGRQVQVSRLNGPWTDDSPYWVLEYIKNGQPPENFRIKPKTININGHEVPEPVREPLENGQSYFRAAPWNWRPYGAIESVWYGNDSDILWLSRGLIHLTAEAAEAHAKALLSFTQLPEGAKSA